MGIATFVGHTTWFPDHSRLYLQVETVESSTGERKTINNTACLFVRSPYVFKFSRSSQYFKPSLPYDLFIEAYKVNGEAAGLLTVTVESDGITNGQTIPLNTRSVGKESGTFNLDPDGRAMFRVDSDSDMERLKIRVTSDDPDLLDEEQAVGVNDVTPYTSPSNSYIVIRVVNQLSSVRVGDFLLAEVLLSKSTEVNALHFMIVSRGNILHSSTRDEKFGSSVSFQFQISAAMVPSSRLVVYYMTEKDEIVADSVWMDVDDVCHDKLSVMTKHTMYRPEGPADVVVRGAKDVRFGLLAVDQSVYLHRNKDILTAAKVFSDMEKDDQGSGMGGGCDANDVFRSAGLSAVEDTTLDTVGSGRCGATRRRRFAQARGRKFSREQVACCRYGHAANGTAGCEDDATALRNASDICRKIFYRCCMFAEKERYKQLPGFKGMVSDDDGDYDMIPQFDFDVIIEEDEKDIRFRENFAESWMFEDHVMPPSGVSSLKMSFPSTVTEWVIHALSVSASSPLCVAKPRNVTTFTKFFVDVRLPSVAKRMEQLEVVATIFNYHEMKLPVSVYMVGVKGICSEARPRRRTRPLRLYVGAGQSRTVTYPIIPLETGTFKIIVIAFSLSSHDAVKKKLRVTHEGKAIHESKSYFLDPNHVLRGANRAKRDVDGRQVQVIPMAMPVEALPKSERCSVSMIGDVYGPAIQTVVNGVGDMLHLPSGCGEQTMIGLAPTVYAYAYMNVTGKLTPDIKAKGKNFITNGIAHELKYRKSDGSFSVWTWHRASGWLTAFVLKVFRHAQNYGIFVDSAMMCAGVEWLISLQDGEGKFSEQAWVYHKEMVGGVNGDVTLTSFMLITLLETGCNNVGIKNATRRGIEYLEDNLDNITRPLAVAMTTYTLALADSVNATDANRKLMSLATHDVVKETLWWETAGANSFQESFKPFWYQRKPSALSVEMTAYALLAQLAIGDDSRTYEIANWLNTQRNSRGAFVSTQDTSVGLQALSMYAISTYKNMQNLDLSSDLTSTKTVAFKEQIHLMQSDARVLKTVYKVPLGGDLHVNSVGTGTGQMQIELTYHVTEDQKELCPFEMNVTSKVVRLSEEELYKEKPCDVCKEECNKEDKEVTDGADEYEYEYDGGANDDNEGKYNDYNDVDYNDMEDLYARIVNEHKELPASTPKPSPNSPVHSRVGMPPAELPPVDPPLDGPLPAVGPVPPAGPPPPVDPPLDGPPPIDGPAPVGPLPPAGPPSNGPPPVRKVIPKRRIARQAGYGGDGGSKTLVCVRVCARNLRTEESGMAIFEIGLFTGFSPVIEDLQNMVRKDELDSNPDAVADSYELTDRSVIFYLGSVPPGGVCVGFRAQRDHTVINVRPVAVNVYRYYEPSEACTEFYEPDNMNAELMTLCRGRTCVCMEGKCPRIVTGRERAGITVGMLRRKACRSTDYTYKVEVTRVTEATEHKIAYYMITARLLYAARRGANNTPVNSTIDLWYMTSCKSFNLVNGQKYVVMGTEGQYRDRNNRLIYRYLLDDESLILPFLDENDEHIEGYDHQLARRQATFFKSLKKTPCRQG